MAEYISKTKLVIAIEIGNVNSGYVFFSGKENSRVLTATYGNGLPEDREPTALLLNSDLSLDSFGTRAKDRYFILTIKKEEDKYTYFENRLQMSIETKEDRYAKIIEYLYEKCLESLAEKRCERKIEVKNVSLIFPETEIMRSAVKKARIKKKKIKFVHEMDAAAIYCGDHDSFVEYDGNVNVKKLTKGDKFAVLDLGGEKAQYCKYKVKGKDNYKRISEVMIAPFGGETVTENFIKTLQSIVDKDDENKWKNFTIENKSDYLSIRRSFEKHKLTFDSSKPDIIMEMPKAFIRLVGDKTCDGISFEKEHKIIVQRKILEGLFDESLREIVEKLKHDISDIRLILLVGGFSESSYVIDYIKGEIKSIPVVLVHKPALAVLKGTVMGEQGHVKVSKKKISCKSLKTEGKYHCKDVFKKDMQMKESEGPCQLGEKHLPINDMRKKERSEAVPAQDEDPGIHRPDYKTELEMEAKAKAVGKDDKQDKKKDTRCNII